MFRDRLDVYVSERWPPRAGEVLQRIADGSLSAEEAGPLLTTRDMPESDRRQLLGLVLAMSGYPAEAVECMEAVVEAEQDNNLALANLAAIWKSYGFRHNAQLLYDRISQPHVPSTGTATKLTRESRDEFAEQEESFAYLTLRRKALEEALNRTDDSFGGRIELGMNYVALGQLGEDLFEAAETLLEKANREEGDKRPLLEVLAWLYNRTGKSERLDGVLRDLERLNPYVQWSQSKSVEEIDQPPDSGIKGFVSLLRLLVMHCLQKRDDWPQALKDIREIFGRVPDDSLFRGQALIAELATDNVPEATRHARALAMTRTLSYEEHFNVSQVLWRDGDHASARFHLECAQNLAQDDEERADVISLVKLLETDEYPEVWEDRDGRRR